MDAAEFVLVAVEASDECSGAMSWARQYGVPVLEPRDADEAHQMHAMALDMVKEFHWPVFLCLGFSVGGFCPTPSADWCVPELSDVVREALVCALANDSERCPFSVLERGSGSRASRRVGFITCGSAYQDVRRLFPDAPVLRLGMSYPLPLRKVRGIVEMCGTVFVIGAPGSLIEDELLAEGVSVRAMSLSALSGVLDNGL